MTGNSSLLWMILLPLLGSVLCFAIGKVGEKKSSKSILLAEHILFSAVQVATLALVCVCGVISLKNGAFSLEIPKICGKGMNFTFDGFRVLYVGMASLAWTVSSLFSRWYMSGEHHVIRYDFFTLLTMGATIGVFLSADLYTTFLFFEVMSLASYVWVAQEETFHALRASETYLCVAVMGGLTMLMGLFLLDHEIGTLVISELPAACDAVTNRGILYVAGFCMLFGFGAKAGCFPLHIWLPKAHPVAPAPASALLSGILTKSGIFGCLILCGRMFRGDEFWGKMLLTLAVCTMLVGALIALFSFDMKQVLACSSVSQIGFILTGCGLMSVMEEEQGLAVAGSMLHMVNHSLFKLVLFILAGICVKNLESRDLNVLRGFGRNKPWFMVVYLLGALGIAGVPGFSGYVSKTMLHEAIVECYKVSGDSFFKVTEVLFLIAGGCTLAYMLKLFVCLFVKSPSKKVQEVDAKKQGRYLPLSLKIVLGVTALSIFVMGSLPEWTMFKVAKKAADLCAFHPMEEDLNVFSWECLKGGLISIAIGLTLYFGVVQFLVRKRVKDAKGQVVEELYVNRWPAFLDLEDSFYRPVLFGLLHLLQLVLGFIDRSTEMVIIALRKTVLRPVCETTTTSLVGTVLNGIGHMRNGFQRVANATFHRSKKKHVDYVEVTNKRWSVLTETFNLASRSLSYGLMAFSIGLLVLLVYLLYRM